jgi:hypothetical protein
MPKLTLDGLDPSVASLSLDTEFKPAFITEDEEGKNLTKTMQITLFGPGWKVLGSAEISHAQIARLKPMTNFSANGYKFMKILRQYGAGVSEEELMKKVEEIALA